MHFNPVDSRWLYNIVDNSMRALHPVSDYYQTLAKKLTRMSDSMNLPMNLPNFSDEQKQKLFKSPRRYLRYMAGSCYVYHMLLDTYHKPAFDINEVRIGDTFYDIHEEIIKKRSFCDLINFKKMKFTKELPKMLLIAPMSGHYATLLRDTVRDMLPFYDVFITDWKNARDVPLIDGSFDFNNYVQYLMNFMQYLGPDTNMMAVCQSTVPALVATAVMTTNNDPCIPRSLILLGGPIDTDQAPTAVNELATTRGDDWFIQNVISIVPSGYPGYMRLVYPGFLQLSGFMSMNLTRHIESLKGAVQHYADDNSEGAFKTIKFYTEYFSVMDLTAEFYMQTMNTVFQEKLLVQGRLKYRGKYAQLLDIDKTALLAIEGGKDDITGIGQTKSVLELCKNLPDTMKKYVLAEEVGHYGLFNGSKFRKVILPEIRSFIKEHKPQAH